MTDDIMRAIGNLEGSVEALHKGLKANTEAIASFGQSMNGRIRYLEEDIHTARGALKVVKWVAPTLGAIAGYLGAMFHIKGWS